MKMHQQLEDGTIWPTANDHHLEWRVRYGSVESLEKDRYTIASYIAAYKEMIRKTNVRRNEICKQLKSK